MMTGIEVWLMAAALAMDCLAVALASGMILKRMEWRPVLFMTFFFGFFQALNPLIGWSCAEMFRSIIERFDHWIAFSILLFLGVRMVLESFKDEEQKTFNPRSLKIMLTMAIATSIDAFAVGISFSCMGYESLHALAYPLIVIGIVSSLFTLVGLFAGATFGRRLAQKLRAELFGGIVLVAIGVKVLIEHLSAGV